MQRADESQEARLARIRDGLLGWFNEHARDLPWRRTRDPYAILVSEVMLQQTQVDRVLPYYTRFLERFPTVEDLAAAATSDVIRFWSGLGYNRRAVNLQRAARAVVDELSGSFPDDPADLKKLPGIGAYTAGAIAAFAHERDVAFLDTNMRRVISRVIFGSESARESDALEAATALVPPSQGWTWNQALIEFGALQCTARRPACIICPLRDECAAYPTMQVALQVKSSRTRQVKAEPFESTTRFYRGRIVEALRALPADEPAGIPLTELGVRVREGFTSENLPWLRELVDGLQRDGLALVAEDSPPYEADYDNPATSPRVRLP
ncbi:MAG: HhH-GPD family protein [Thermomicrobiales bacterium]|jgi:A/G-specific adenine glycosylase|nr:HhH-GPD family protein [Thermomicrobiales bacterium]